MASQLSDEELYESWRAGSQSAGNALFDRYFRAVHRFFLAKIDDVTAKTLTQKTFFTVVKKRDTVTIRTSFRAFLFKIARFVLLAEARDRSRNPAFCDFSVASVAALQTSPSQALARREKQKIVIEAMRQLPIDEQTLLELYYWEGLTGAEISEVLEIKHTTVRSKLSKTRAKLRTMIGKVVRGEGDVEQLYAKSEDIIRSMTIDPQKDS